MSFCVPHTRTRDLVSKLAGYHRLGSLGLLTLCMLGLCAMDATSALAQSQLPVARLDSVFPAGARKGGVVEMTITGGNLELAEKLHFSHEGITAAQKMRDPSQFEEGPQVVPNQFTVTVAAGVPPGIYEVRAIGKFGISNSRAFLVSDAKGNEVLEKEANNTVETAQEVALEDTINGRINGATDQDYFKIELKKGQRVLADCWAYRIDSRLDGTLTLFDAEGNELDSNRDTNRRDPLLDFTAPADGSYILRIHDFIYGGSNDHVYRLHIGTSPYIDYIIPSSTAPGSKGEFTLYGRNLPGGQPSDVKINGKPLQQLKVQVQAPGGEAQQQLAIGTLSEPEDSSIDGFEYRLASPQGSSNPVLIGFATAPVVLEQEPNNKHDQLQKVSPPCEVVGQFNPRRDLDRFEFEAKKGDVFWLEVYAKRHGVPADPFLLVQRVTVDKDGKEQVSDVREVDDEATNPGGQQFNVTCDDPSYKFTAPSDGKYRVLVRDLYNRGHPRYVYRLAIRAAQPDFRLVAVPKYPTATANQTGVWNPLLRKGGSEQIDLLLFRRDGFDSSVEISTEGLPAGVTASSVTIGPAQNSAPLVLTAADSAKNWVGAIKITGKAKINEKDVVRQARAGAATWAGATNSAAPARLTRNLALAVIEKESLPYTVTLGDGKPLEMSRAGKLEIPVKVVRRDGFKGNLALSTLPLPNNLRIANVSINGAATDGKLLLTIPNNYPLGQLSLNMTVATQVEYSLNPDLAELAKVDKERLDKILAEAKKQLTDAQKAAQTADAAAKKADAGVKTADAAVAKTDGELKKAVAEAQKAEAGLKKSEAALKTAEAELAKAPEDAAKQQAKAAAEKAKAEAEKTKATVDKAKTDAETAKAAADKAKEAAAKLKVDADKAKADADKLAKDMDVKVKAATAAQKVAAKKATDTANAAKKKKLNSVAPTTPVTVLITEAPIVLKQPAAPAPLKQGEKMEVTVSVDRLYDYKDAFQLDVQIPGGAKGVAADRPKIEKDKKDAKLTLTAAATATPGDHTLTVRATVRYNNQNLIVTQDFPIKVEEVKKEEKK